MKLDDAMDDETLHFGPNGGLVFCMEYFAKNFEWLIEQLGEDEDDDYIIFDCPGQIELYTHLPIMKQLVDNLEKWNFRVSNQSLLNKSGVLVNKLLICYKTCGVFLVDAQFLVDTPKFFAGVLAALSVMVTLEIPHLNVMSKIDLLDKVDKDDLHK